MEIKLDLIKFDPLLQYKRPLDIFISQELHKNIIGPVYNREHISFFRVIRKIEKLDMDIDLNYRIGHLIIKKKLKFKSSLYEKKIQNELRYIKLIKKKIINSSRGNTYKKYLKEKYVRRISLPIAFFRYVKYLNENEISNIFETKHGWHIIIMLNKKLEKDTFTYLNLSPHIRIKKQNKQRQKIINKNMKRLYIRLNAS